NRTALTDDDRFWLKVDKEGPASLVGPCWQWTACLAQNGYGLFSYKRRVQGAHRASWQITNGLIPNNLHVLHRCDNRACVRPDHLFLGTHSDNMIDASVKNRCARSLAKLTPNQVRDIRVTLNGRRSGYRIIASEYGVHFS